MILTNWRHLQMIAFMAFLRVYGHRTFHLHTSWQKRSAQGPLRLTAAQSQDPICHLAAANSRVGGARMGPTASKALPNSRRLSQHFKMSVRPHVISLRTIG